MCENFEINVLSFWIVQPFWINLGNNTSFGLTGGQSKYFGCLKYSMNVPSFSNVPKYILENGWINHFKGTLEGIFLQMVQHISNHFFSVANIYEKVGPKWEQVVKRLQSLKLQYFPNAFIAT